MYIWNTQELVNDIANNRLTERQKFSYYIFYCLLIAVILSELFMGMESTVVRDVPILWVDVIIGLIITYVGMLKCFKTNEAFDGKDSIARFMSIGIPIMIRITVFIFAFAFVWALIAELYSVIDLWDDPIGLTIFNSCIGVIYYWRLNVAFSKLPMSKEA